MAVYVDKAVSKFGRMIMCHMTADNLDELFDMVDRIGVRRKWFQDGRMPHFDICKSKRELAIMEGAIQVSQRDIVKKAKALRDNMDV